jgi:hypothetical protein
MANYLPKAPNRAGERYGYLTVIERAHRIGKVLFWKCRCDCGTEKAIRYGNLANGSVTSCGCRRLAATIATGKANTKHGHARLNLRTPEYRTWRGMRQRCLDPNHNYFHRYGGRGIRICKRWDSFSVFLADMGKRPKNKTLDRHPNPDGDYKPSNCRWATRKQQRKNRSKK